MNESNEQEIQRELAKEGEPSPAVNNDPASTPQEGKKRRIIAPDPEAEREQDDKRE